MITTNVTKMIQEQLSGLRAETETVNEGQHIDSEGTVWSEPTSWGEGGSCYGKYNVRLRENYDKLSDECFEEMVITTTQSPKFEQMTFDALLSTDGDTIKFYQDIADAAKEWTEKPSDKRNSVEALRHVLDLAKNVVDSYEGNLAATLKNKESIRIVSNIVEHFEK